jgi:uncharacterized protein involved in exopolysaccharide biosynthesis
MRRAEIEQDLKGLLALNTLGHPSVRPIESQLQVAQYDLDRIASHRIAERARLRPPLEQEVFRLQRDVQVNSELYTSLRNRYEQLRVVKAGTIRNVRVVDVAVAPEQQEATGLQVYASVSFSAQEAKLTLRMRHRLFQPMRRHIGPQPQARCYLLHGKA